MTGRAPWETGDHEQRWLGYFQGPDHIVLRNKVGARTPEALSDAENDLVELRLAELRARPGLITRSFDLDHLRSLHRHLFQDVYEWAGELRTVGLAKGGGESFVPPLDIARPVDHGAECIRQLRTDAGSAIANLPERLAYIYDYLNFAHPFREGNGRTQREFFAQLLEELDYRLAWDRVTMSQLHEACHVARNESDSRALITVFEKVLVRDDA